MSESSIARWNVIPMIRQDQPEHSLKRKRQEDDMVEDDDDDDDVSLISRSSSPVDEAMDVDPGDNISKYDEFIRKPTQETVTIDTKIKPTNRGFGLLAKMGWVEGQPLGLSGDGLVDPIPFEIKQDTLGIGRATQESSIAAEAVSSRRGLDSERQIQETDEQRRAREDTAARKAAVQGELTNTLRAFYCTLCEKQFQTVAQYDEHTNSYAHHHKARFKDMQANARIKPQEEIDKRKEKERKREERELRKIAAAAGIKMPKPPATLASGSQLATASVAPAVAAADVSSSMDAESSSSTQKKGGWATIGSASAPAPGFKKSGWLTGSSPEPPKSSSGWAPVSSTTPPSPPTASSLSNAHTSHTPSFRTGGWTSLDTGSTATVQPPPPPTPLATPNAANTAASMTVTSSQTPLPTPPSPPSSNFRPVIGGDRTRGEWTSVSSTGTSVSHSPGPRSQSQSQHESSLPKPVSAPALVPAPVPPTASSTSSRLGQTPPAEPERSGWQKFQAKNLKRK